MSARSYGQKRRGQLAKVLVSVAVVLTLLATSGSLGSASANPTIPCQWCCQGHCGGGGAPGVPVLITVYVFNGSGYATVNGTKIYNGQTKTPTIAPGNSLVCNVDTSKGYAFAGWYSTKLTLANPSSCSTTFTTVVGGGGEILTLLLSSIGGGWSGYSMNSTQPFHEVSGIFTIPNTQQYFPSTPVEQVAEWVGFGASETWWSEAGSGNNPGFSGHAIWQAGVTEEYGWGTSGSCSSNPQSFMWYEFFPYLPVYLVPTTCQLPSGYTTGYSSFVPNEGDSIQVTLTIWYISSVSLYEGNVTFEDLTNGDCLFLSNLPLGSIQAPVYPQLNDVEWIVESPWANGYLVPQLTSEVYFTGGWYVGNGFNTPQYANATHELAQWVAEIYGQSLCPGMFGATNGDFSVRYSTSAC